MADLQDVNQAGQQAYGFWGKSKQWVSKNPGYSLTIMLIEFALIIGVAAA